MDLLVDIGNSRVKWGYNDIRLEPGVPVIHQDSDFEVRLFSIWRTLPKSPQRMAISCVASKTVLDQVKTIALDLWPSLSIIQAHSVAEAYGVRNAYEFPEKLGVDRWLCLIAARHYWSEPVCIVDCGTAITIDAMDRNGCHLGGLICPGLILMKQSLSNGTANLQFSAQSGLPNLARNTSDAIDNGALYAVIGLIKSVIADLNKPVKDVAVNNSPILQRDRLLDWLVSAAEKAVAKPTRTYSRRPVKRVAEPSKKVIVPGCYLSQNPKLVLTGGDAGDIAPHLDNVSCVVPDLVLKGLSLILAE
ncbi:MAG: type III pantothenate kinase [Gammaproteobacteria bacterium]|uniref:type III pantothenate kinase n=1 Tax=Methylotuvimicrobium sp. TaxID=2822413 RepID=UPI001D723677|nr:type III pantothenate kinase [Gammaproteobacteria bacterium]